MKAEHDKNPVLPLPPATPANKKRQMSNSSSQTTLNSFVLKSTSQITLTGATHSIHSVNPYESKPKKPCHNTLLQPTLFDLPHTDSRNDSRHNQTSRRLRNDCLTSSNASTRFKRRHLTSPMSSSKKRKDSLIKHKILEKRRKWAVSSRINFQ